jgi:hypothetical protein
MHLWCPHVRQCSNSMPVQRRQSDLVEVYDSDPRHARSCKRSCCMGADAAKANDDDEGGAEGRKADVVKRDPVAGELFEDQLVIIVASSGSSGDLGAPGVFFAC